MVIFLCKVCLLFLAVIKLSAANCMKDNEETWSYHGSQNHAAIWPIIIPDCNKLSQSPIDIFIPQVTRDPQISLAYFGYDDAIETANVVNNGHTVKITPRDNYTRGITAKGKDYNLQQLHFHWGSREHPGGEHKLNGYRFEMEVHLVHQSADNEIAVVGILVRMVEHDNSVFEPVVEVLNDVMFKGNSAQLKSILNLGQILPESPDYFYGYTGSLTTPPCTEGVAWFVLQNQQTIGDNQLNHFLSIFSVEREYQESGCLLAPNNRPFQNLNSRTVYSPSV